MPDPGETPSSVERLFFALWPDDALRQRLVHRSKPIVQAARGRPVPAENLHITLAFLGSVNARQRACVCDMADVIVCPSFELRLDRVGHWPRSRVLWLASGEISQALNQLAADLYSGASACGLSLDDRPYRPHLTLLRKFSAGPEVLAVDPTDWQASDFALLRSVSTREGVQYEVLRRWQLTA